MRLAFVSLAIAFDSVGMVIADDTSPSLPCTQYLFNDPNQSDFNEGSDQWVEYDDLPFLVDSEMGNGFVPETVVSAPWWGTWFNPDRNDHFNYTVSVNFNVDAGNDYEMKIKPMNDKGLSTSFLIGFKDTNDKFMAINWMTADECCSRSQEFSATDISRIKIYSRAHY